MPEIKTLTFPNSAAGQREKVQALQHDLAQGWVIVSESVTEGHLKGGEACCLATICLPCGFLAGRKSGTIYVALQRHHASPPPLPPGA